MQRIYYGRLRLLTRRYINYIITKLKFVNDYKKNKAYGVEEQKNNYLRNPLRSPSALILEDIGGKVINK